MKDLDITMLVFHLGADYCTMDFDGTISKEQLKEIEAAANEAVYQDLEIEILYPSKDELKDMDYRKARSRLRVRYVL